MVPLVIYMRLNKNEQTVTALQMKTCYNDKLKEHMGKGQGI